jgi:hypothetical protein
MLQVDGIMQIELIGCTGAGKSTLARGILQADREHGIDALMGDEFVLKQVRLNWVKGRLARTLCMDLLSLFACLVTWRDNHEFYLFVMRIISRLPVAVALFEKVNIARNALKNIGIYEIVRRRGSDQQIVLVDEGTLHTAHYLFVHVSVEPNASDLSTFARLVPLPDVAICVQQDEAVLIERTLARGHKRIPDGSYAQVKRFIERAADTFDKLMRQLLLESRLLVVACEQDLVVTQDYRNDPLPAGILRIIGAGRDAVLADNPTGIMQEPGPQDVQAASSIPL